MGFYLSNNYKNMRHQLLLVIIALGSAIIISFLASYYLNTQKEIEGIHYLNYLCEEEGLNLEKELNISNLNKTLASKIFENQSPVIFCYYSSICSSAIGKMINVSVLPCECNILINNKIVANNICIDQI